MVINFPISFILHSNTKGDDYVGFRNGQNYCRALKIKALQKLQSPDCVCEEPGCTWEPALRRIKGKIRVLLCIEGFFTLGFVDSGHFFVSVSLSILLGEVGWELGRLLLYSYVSLFFSLGSRALTIYFMFYNGSDLNCLHLRCFNLLIFCRKVWRDLWFEGRRGV